MADFERTAELSIELDAAELRRTRGELEDALADIPVGVDAAAGGAAGVRGGGDSSRERRRRRREFRWARQRTDDIETQVELLENIEGELTEGGLGGGGGIAGDLLGLGGEGAGIATDLGTSVVDAVAPALGSLIGTALGQQVGGGGDSGGGSTRLSIEEPLGVTVENTPLAIEDDGSGPRVEVDVPEVNPTFEPVFNPTFRPTFEQTLNPELTTEVSPDFDLPDFNVSGGGGSGLSEPVSVIVENTPLPVEGRPRGGRRAPSGGGNGSRPRGPGESIGKALDDTSRFIEDAIGLPEEGRVNPLQGFGRAADRANPFFGGLGQLPDQQGGGGGGGGVSASTGDINVTIQADLQSAVQQAMEQVRREQERQRQQLRNDLEGQINDLRRQLSGGRGGGRGGASSVGVTR